MDQRKKGATELRSKESNENSSKWSRGLTSTKGGSRPSTGHASSDSSNAAPARGAARSRNPRQGSWDSQASGSDHCPLPNDQLYPVSSTEGEEFDVNYFPAEDSTDGSGTETETLKSRSTTQQSSQRLLRYISKKLGRTFNKKAGFRGRLFLPNDQAEWDRNMLQHDLLLDIHGSNLFLNPSKPKTVLDIGTGPGIWALQVAQKFPEAKVLGIDVDKVQPPYRVSNCRFEVVDASQPWPFEQSFDFIHMRCIGELPCGKHKLFDTMYDHLNPGGWIEITDWISQIRSPNHSLDHFNFWNRTFKQGLERLGSSVNYPLAWKPIMERRGCHHVTERKYPVPLNTWPPGRRQQKQGAMMAQNAQAFLEGTTMPVFKGALGWSDGQVQDLLVDLRAEVVDPNVHGYLIIMTVYCQKPRQGSSNSSSSRLQSKLSYSTDDTSGRGSTS